MNSKTKIINIEEKLNTGNDRESESVRRFKIHKFSAKTSLKIAKLLSAKVLPVFDGVMKLLGDDINPDDISLDNLNQMLNIDSIAKALDMISDDDLDKLIDTALRHCFEILSGNEAQVLNGNGSFGVQNVEDDPILVMRLTVEAVWFSVSSFFNGSRLGSILKPLAASFQFNA